MGPKTLQRSSPSGSSHLYGFFAPGVGLESTTCGLTDHRISSEVFIWTASACRFRPPCLSGMSVSVWWCAFGAMRCATPTLNTEDSPLRIGAALRIGPDLRFFLSGCRDLNSGPSVPQITEICPGSPPGPLMPVDSGTPSNQSCP